MTDKSRDALTLECRGVTAEFTYETTAERDRLWWMEDAETKLLEDLIGELRPADVLYDIGANVGVVSCLAGTQLTDGEVVAFEPYRPNSKRLMENLSRNLPQDRYLVVSKAAAASTGTVPFSVPDDGEPSAQVGHIALDGAENSVPAIMGDEFVSGSDITPPTVMKIDVEGAESEVLDGFEKTLSGSTCRVLYLEIHLEKPAGDRPSMQAFGVSPSQLRDKLSEFGFEIVNKRRRSTELHLKAVRES